MEVSTFNEMNPHPPEGRSIKVDSREGNCTQVSYVLVRCSDQTVDRHRRRTRPKIHPVVRKLWRLEGSYWWVRNKGDGGGKNEITQRVN